MSLYEKRLPSLRDKLQEAVTPEVESVTLDEEVEVKVEKKVKGRRLNK